MEIDFCLFLLNLYFVQANHPDNEDNLVGVRLLPLVHPDHGQELEGGRGGVHLRQLSTGDTQL